MGVFVSNFWAKSAVDAQAFSPDRMQEFYPGLPKSWNYASPPLPSFPFPFLSLFSLPFLFLFFPFPLFVVLFVVLLLLGDFVVIV